MKKVLILCLTLSLSLGLTACNFENVEETFNKVSDGIKTVQTVSNMVQNFDGVENIPEALNVAGELINSSTSIETSEVIEDIDGNGNLDEQISEGLDSLNAIIKDENGEIVNKEDIADILNTLNGLKDFVKNNEENKQETSKKDLEAIGGFLGEVGDILGNMNSADAFGDMIENPDEIYEAMDSLKNMVDTLDVEQMNKSE